MLLMFFVKSSFSQFDTFDFLLSFVCFVSYTTITNLKTKTNQRNPSKWPSFIDIYGRFVSYTRQTKKKKTPTNTTKTKTKRSQAPTPTCCLGLHSTRDHLLRGGGLDAEGRGGESGGVDEKPTKTHRKQRSQP